MGSETQIGDAAVRQATGRSWSDWFRILDAYGGRDRGHREMARYLLEKRGASPWWSQTITVRYELERGLRDVGQRGKTFEVSVSRTVRAAPEEAFEALTTARHWNRWFTSRARVDAKPGGRYSNGDGDGGKFLAVDPPRRVRFTWENAKHCPNTVVEITIRPKDDGRIVVRLTHGKLATSSDREEMRGGWSRAMDSLRSYLETGKGIPSDEWEPSR